MEHRCQPAAALGPMSPGCVGRGVPADLQAIQRGPLGQGGPQPPASPSLPPPPALAQRFRCCPHAVCTAQGLLAKVGGYTQLGSWVPTPPTQRGQCKEGGWRCWGCLCRPCKPWSLSCISRLQRHHWGFGGDSRPYARRQRGTRAGSPRLCCCLHCPAPPLQ